MYYVGCNYLFMLERPASGNKVHICITGPKGANHVMVIHMYRIPASDIGLDAV